MIYMRGNPHDYDEWERLGNKGWSYKDCLPYFEKLDKLMSPEFARHSTLLKDAFLKAGKMMGYPVLDRQLHGQACNIKIQICNAHIITNPVSNQIFFLYTTLQASFAPYQFNIREGKRWTTSQAYLLPVIKERQNLHVALHSHVYK